MKIYTITASDDIELSDFARPPKTTTCRKRDVETDLGTSNEELRNRMEESN